MKFCSTRGGVKGASFEEAISTGYAPDGGLYVPEKLPAYWPKDLENLRKLSFHELAEEIIGKFVGDELKGVVELSELVQGMYSGFTHEEIIPVTLHGGIMVAELFHGPPYCFKDLGQQPLIRLLAAFAKRRGSRHTMLVSTTGDTGPAAMRAVRDSG